MEEEATVVTKLKDAGAIMLGTATLTEWCNLRTTHSPHGWSASWGQCYGAYYPHQDPGGSSSGSAVAVSVGFAPAALGTEVRLLSEAFLSYPNSLIESPDMGEHHHAKSEVFSGRHQAYAWPSLQGWNVCPQPVSRYPRCYRQERERRCPRSSGCRRYCRSYSTSSTRLPVYSSTWLIHTSI